MMIEKNLLHKEASSFMKNLFKHKFTAFYHFISIKNSCQIISFVEQISIYLSVNNFVQNEDAKNKKSN